MWLFLCKNLELRRLAWVDILGNFIELVFHMTYCTFLGIAFFFLFCDIEGNIYKIYNYILRV